MRRSTNLRAMRRRQAGCVLLAMAGLVAAQVGRAQAASQLATRPQSTLKIASGTVAGYIFWDARRVAYSPSLPCQGLEVNLSAITGTGVQSLGSSTHFQFLQSAKNGSGLDLCSYSFLHVPDDVALEVKLSVSMPFAAHVAAIGPFPVGPTGTLIKIPGGQCANPSTGTTPSSTYLESGWIGCGEHAYNVNFQLVPWSMASRAVRSRVLAVPQNPGAAKPASKLRKAVKVGPPKSGPKVTNPFAAEKSTAFLMQLDQQFQAAQKEAARMKLAPVAVGGGSSPHTTSARAGAKGLRTPGAGGTPASQTPSSPTRSEPNLAPRTVASAPSALLKPSNPGTLGPEGTTGSLTNSQARLMAAPNPLSTLALTCAHDPTMRILNVSGSFLPVTFTTIEKYDFYVIAGCSFGNPGGNAKAYLAGAGFHQEFQIRQWQDNSIALQLDPYLSGIADQDNLTLTVVRADGKQASKNGFKFYAARQEVLLHNIPRPAFSLNKFTMMNINTTGWVLTYSSPGSVSDGYGFGGMSVEVQWGDPNLPFMKSAFDTKNAPPPGTDVYDFRHLQPGFVPTGAAMEWQDASSTCSFDGGALVTSGGFNLEWQSDQALWVDWQGQNCRSVNCGGAFQTDCFAVPLTNYGLDVWVEGPRGVKPWSGPLTLHKP